MYRKEISTYKVYGMTSIPVPYMSRLEILGKDNIPMYVKGDFPFNEENRNKVQMVSGSIKIANYLDELIRDGGRGNGKSLTLISFSLLFTNPHDTIGQNTVYSGIQTIEQFGFKYQILEKGMKYVSEIAIPATDMDVCLIGEEETMVAKIKTTHPSGIEDVELVITDHTDRSIADKQVLHLKLETGVMFISCAI